ncbi:polyketide synthase [Aspergillus piperis CBS 112811]|uniref:Polyketide synthase n=1 Tax=Aspergillus piperis CBS 112811 TaxID=1448313 RepID=A0A8G1R7M9_9EURO|nr:polyketide synthase [Aspergillus piperis CBS 112811]RAH60136.1 polyketide synthase [Aspergillus piperis CBS 112811]
MKHSTSTTPCEPIAIIGIGCRLPGQASSPSKLWDLLINNATGYGPVPPSRFNAAAYYHPDADRPGSINSTGGYFIQEDIRAFENAFFGINNLEATSMDPQQRKLLEVTYEALENAGIPLEKVHGTNTGVYVGNFTNDFLNMQYKDPEYSSRYTATGTGLAVLANRITHCFDLRGPSHVVDTACSSSLYALHSACLALDAGDCDAAVVAAANLIQSPEQQMVAVKAGVLSPDAMCHTFDEKANGYARAEGVSAVYLKRLGDALSDGDPVRSVIRGTAVNGNGRTPGISQPSVEGQRAVIRAAYRRAGLDPGETDYVEAHGTGTKVGDPTEVEAISGVFQHRAGRPTLVGGVKPNLGHSEGASGLSGLIKTILTVENKIIPATVGVKVINPRIKCKEWNVDIVTANQAWPGSQNPRASVNSFGFGGSNSVAIVEAWEPDLVTNGYGESPMASDLAELVSHSAHPVPINDLAYTLSCRRSKMGTRGFFIESQASLNKGLDMSNLRLRGLDNEEPFPLGFVYTGQGTQWAGMAKELFSNCSVFESTIKYLDSCLQTLAPKDTPTWTLEGILRGKENHDISAAEISQPLCTAVQIALTNMLKDWGVSPETVVGHSSGEIGAAYATGAIDARQAIFAAYFRGAVVSEVSAEGSMVAVGLGKDQAQAIVEECGLTESAIVACANSPESTTVSGDADAIYSLLRVFQKRGIWARKLMTGGTAYHSHHMKAISGQVNGQVHGHVNGYPNGFSDGHINSHDNEIVNGYVNGSVDGHVSEKVNGYANGQLDGQGDTPTPSVTMISTATGGRISTNQVGTTKYWRSNLESPVQFDAAIKIILEQGSYHLIEIGPHSALQLPIKQTALVMKQSRYAYSSALIRHQDAQLTTLQLVGSLFLHGHDELQYHKMFVDTPQPHVLVDLPPYPWDYSSPTLWTEPRASVEFRHRKYPRHELLGSQVSGGNTAGVTWRNILDLNEADWLTHHCLGAWVLFPAAAYIAMIVEAMCQVAGLQLEDSPGVELRNLNFVKALDMDLKKKPSVEIFSEMRPMAISSVTNSDTWWNFSVVSIDGDSRATLHMNAAVRLADSSPCIDRKIKLDKSMMQKDAARVWYDRFLQVGLNWGPRFAVLEEIFRDRARTAPIAASTTHLQRGDRFSRYIANPISIDAMLQTSFIVTTGGWVSKLRATVPVAMDSVYVAPPSALDMDTNKPCRLAPGATVITIGDVPSDGITWTKTIRGSDSFPVTVGTIKGLVSQRTIIETPTVVVTRDENITPLDIKLQKILQEHLGSPVTIVSLSQVSPATVPDRAFVISTLEQQEPLLISMNECEMALLKNITDRVAKIVWVVNGGFIDGEKPDFAPVLGLSRALMLEQPSLQFAVLDVDDESASSGETLRNIINVLDRLIHENEPDFEFAQRDGILHISRWEPDERLNEAFRLKQNNGTMDLSLANAGRCKLDIKDPGHMDTIHFVQEDYSTSLHPDYVEVSVKSVGINAKDLYAISAKVDTKDTTCSCECAGVITAVGDNVSEFKIGDRVVAMAPSHFATVECLPEWAVLKLRDEEDFTTASTIPLVFSTVIYALHHRAHLQPGESVLVHSAAGGVGMAAIQYAKHLGAKIFATVGNETKKSFLVEKYGLDPTHIFSSRNSSFLPAIMEATSGQGVDVVLNSLTGDLLRSSFEACADFGRFIDIGKRDILDHGLLDMSTFGRNVAFIAFDLSHLYLSKNHTHHRLWKTLLTESLQLMRAKICEPCFPIKTFEASNITDAFRHFSLGTRLGKVTVSFQVPNTKIRVIPKKYETAFIAQKSYLMIGGLGGLGRSISKWMISCGARRFISLSRSGTDKPEAKDLVDDLQAQGAHIIVIRGDVCRYEDVERAVAAADCPIGGVIQATMVLNEAIWSDMPHNAWYTTMGPKVRGTWNLHNVLRKKGRDSQLDFFVMTSSISGTIGTATESNYCAANSFLDAFARYRNHLGLPAISIGYGMISEVGYLHEHADIEALMKRAGVHPINENELIQIMNLALVNQRPCTWDPRYDHLAGSHILTGVEFTSLQEQRERGFEGDNHVLADPRAALFTASFARGAAGEGKSETQNAAAQLPGDIARALRDNQNMESCLDALRAVVSKKISNLILLPENDLKADQPLGDSGLDSMLAAEFRTFVFRMFEVDIPFIVLLKRSTTVNHLVDIIAQGLRASA